MTFRIGQKVVCVRAGVAFECHVICPLKEGTVYTIIGIRTGPERQHGAGIMVDGDAEHFWSQKRFRPAVERKTDIGFAHEILRKVTKPARTPALSQHERG